MEGGSDLALARTDGSVAVLRIRRTVNRSQSGVLRWEMDVEEIRQLDQGDKRAIAAIRWIEVSASSNKSHSIFDQQQNILVWTKPGSVHLWSEGKQNDVSWEGLKTVRLERIGNWASANALGPCIGQFYPSDLFVKQLTYIAGIHSVGPDQLLITLSSFTQHLIADFRSSPKLSAKIESIRLSLVCRDAFLEFAYQAVYARDRYRMAPKDDREISAFVSAFSAVDDGGDIFTWVVE